MHHYTALQYSVLSTVQDRTDYIQYTLVLVVRHSHNTTQIKIKPAELAFWRTLI